MRNSGWSGWWDDHAQAHACSGVTYTVSPGKKRSGAQPALARRGALDG
jgi:hypothetical protein